MSLSDEVTEEIAEAEAQKAKFCMATQRSGAEYDDMTPEQVSIWVRVYAEMNKG